jgi:hypothetical protein
VEQGYGVRDARDEPAQAGEQQQFFDLPDQDVLPRKVPETPITTSRNLGSASASPPVIWSRCLSRLAALKETDCVAENGVRSETVSRPVLPAICDLQGDFQKLQEEPIRCPSNFVMVSISCKGPLPIQ